MKYFLTVIMLLVLMASCKKANSNQDVCNMLYYYSDSDAVEVEEAEPELIPVPLDTAVKRLMETCAISHGDSLRLGNGIKTQARGGDVLLEKAIYELLMNRNLTIQCAKSPELYICLMGKDEIDGNTFADFRKIK